jgi:hypothetical protein
MSGGPAFPHEYKYGDGTAQRADGMTLRDYFAAHAMGAAFVEADYPYARQYEETARHAYTMADAMLAAREVTP